MMVIMEMEMRITVFETSIALPASTYARSCTRHSPSVEVGPVPAQQPRRKSDYHTRALDRSIASTAPRTFFDSRGEIGGEG